MTLSRRSLLTAAPALIGCNRSRGSGIRILAPSLPTPFQLPVVVANEMGYFRQYNLSTQIEDSTTGLRAIESALSGAADVISILFDQLILMAAENRPLRSFCLVESLPVIVLAVSPAKRNRINKISDLRGRTIGVTSPGSSVHFQVSYLLKRAGVDPGEVSAIGIGSNAARLAALESGKVDAAVLGDPGATLLERRHRDVLFLSDTRTPEGTRKAFGSDSYPGCVLVATEKWLRGHPADARALTAAVLKAMQWIRETAPERVTARIPPQYRTEDESLYSDCIRKLTLAFSKDGIMPAGLPQLAKEVLSTFDEKIRSANIDPGRTYTNDYVARST